MLRDVCLCVRNTLVTTRTYICLVIETVADVELMSSGTRSWTEDRAYRSSDIKP